MGNIINDINSAQNEPKDTYISPIKGAMWALKPDGSVTKLPPLIYQFMYNPTELTDHKEVVFTSISAPGSDRPFVIYQRGGERIIEFTLFLNSYEFGSSGNLSFYGIPGLGGISTELAILDMFVHPYVELASGKEALQKYTTGAAGLSVLSFINLSKNGVSNGENRPAQFTPPPKCLFMLGVRIHECFVKSLVPKITMWNSVMDPVRAEVRVTLSVDENSPRAVMDDNRRLLQASLGVLNVNPLSSIPTIPSVGRIL